MFKKITIQNAYAEDAQLPAELSVTARFSSLRRCTGAAPAIRAAISNWLTKKEDVEVGFTILNRIHPVMGGVLAAPSAP